MPSVRLCVVAAIVVAAATQVVAQSSCNAQSGDYGLYGNYTSNPCSQISSCMATYSTCLGSTLNCTKATACVAAQVQCLNSAAPNTTGCATLNNLQLSLLSLSAGNTSYNVSTAYKSCTATACALLNATYNSTGGNCTLDYTSLCISPVNVVITLLLQGQFSKILSNATLRAAFAAALTNDLIKFLGVNNITIQNMYIQGGKRQATQTLVVVVQVPGVSSSNPGFKAALASLQAAGSSWATSANAVYASATGLTLSVLGVGVGAGSNAFSKGIPVPTTAKPGTSTNTTAAPKTGSSHSGAASRSLLAGAAVALLSTLLF